MVSNRTGAILQDKKGFIWIGTQTGLQRYDGTRFVTYLADVHNADALQSDWISTLFEDSRQRLWVGTSVSGACLLNRKTARMAIRAETGRANRAQSTRSWPFKGRPVTDWGAETGQVPPICGGDLITEICAGGRWRRG